MTLLLLVSTGSTGALEEHESMPVPEVAGLIALYDFNDGEGTLIKNHAPLGEALDLRVDNEEAIHWNDGSLTLIGNTRIQTIHPPRALYDAVTWTGEVTIEAWVSPATTEQEGPARIVTFSNNGSARNFTLGQDGNRFDVRLRTSGTSGNGIPSLSAAEASLEADLTHVVYTRNRAGRARLYVNGVLSQQETIDGTLATWNRDYQFALGNELNDDRPWLGSFHRVALYNRALHPQEVERHYQAGATAPPSAHRAPASNTRSSLLFEQKVAPILAKHCIECHNPATKKGDLDLSNRTALFARDTAVVPGNLDESAVWEAVVSDDMPKKRAPLSPEEKASLRDWIETGATWTHETIDPAVYLRGGSPDNGFSRRLTVNEYIATALATFDVDTTSEAQRILPPDVRADGFQNTAYNLHVDLKHVDAYARLAEMVVDRLDVPRFTARFMAERKLDEKSVRKLVNRMGTWVLRGPLEEHELIGYAGIAPTVISSGGDYDEAVGYIIRAMIQSPRYIYRVENQRGDGTYWPVNGYELASRLSYAIWGASPDAELLKAARQDALNDDIDVLAQVERMLLDPRAATHSQQFAYEWLDLARLDELRPSPHQFPGWKPSLGPAMREETLAFFHEVVWNQQRPLTDLFNAQVTFLTPELAEHYGIERVGDGLQRYDLAHVPERGGLLTQGSLLSMGGDDASMVTRGLFVLNSILRGTVNDPPPGLDTTPVPSSPGASQRVIAEGRLNTGACSGCHTVFEPLAFGLEKFDGLGGYRESDEFENALREDGFVLVPGEAEQRPYATIAELMDVLAASDRVEETLAWKLAQFSVGRPLGPHDIATMTTVIAESKRGGSTYQSLIRAIVMSDLIRKTFTESYS